MFNNDNGTGYNNDGGYRWEYRADAAQDPIGTYRGKPPKKHGAGFIAAVLAVALVGGAAGGGVTAWQLVTNMPAEALGAATAAQEASAAPVEEKPAPAMLEAPEPSVDSGDVADVVDKAAKSVVEISLDTKVQTFFGEQEASSSGSGVIISDDGYIVTNNHVVESGGTVNIRTYDGEEYSGKLIGTDPKTDLAVIKIEAEGLSPVTFADSDAVRVGETAVVIGNPLGTLGGTVTSGIISGMNRELTIENETMNLLQTSAAVNPGNSGGGLFNSGGELIGIVNAKSGGTNIEGLGFAIPSNLAREVTDDIIANGYVTGRAELGIRVVEITDERMARYYGVNETGVYVAEATRQNGLESGDRIVSVGGKAVETARDVAEAVQAGEVGGNMTVEIVRDGKRMTLDVPVAEQVPENVKTPEPSGEM